MRARFLGFLLLLAPLTAAGPAGAQPAQPLDRLLPQIRRDYPGQFLDAEGFNSNGNPHYHLKWLTPDGRVLWLDTDARTGRVVGQSPGRDGFDGPRYLQPPGQYGPRYDGRGDPYSAYGRQYGNGRYGGAPPAGQRFNGGGPSGGGYGNRGFGGSRGRDRGGR